MYMYVHTATVAAVILYRLEQQEMVSFCDGKSDVECVATGKLCDSCCEGVV